MPIFSRRERPLQGMAYDPHAYTINYQTARMMYAAGDVGGARTAAQRLLEQARGVRDELAGKRLQKRDEFKRDFIVEQVIPGARLMLEDIARGVPLRGPNFNPHGFLGREAPSAMDKVLLAGDSANFRSAYEADKAKRQEERDWQRELRGALADETEGRALRTIMDGVTPSLPADAPAPLSSLSSAPPATPAAPEASDLEL
jgi:hypothetical protein